MRIIDGEKPKQSPFSRLENTERVFHCSACNGHILSDNDNEDSKNVIIVCPYCGSYQHQGRALSEDQVDTLMGEEGT